MRLLPVESFVLSNPAAFLTPLPFLFLAEIRLDVE
jgi:hypothetical protein